MSEDWLAALCGLAVSLLAVPAALTSLLSVRTPPPPGSVGFSLLGGAVMLPGVVMGAVGPGTAARG